MSDQPFDLKVHCLEFHRLLWEWIKAPKGQEWQRGFFLDKHMEDCPACQWFFSQPQQYGPLPDEEPQPCATH